MRNATGLAKRRLHGPCRRSQQQQVLDRRPQRKRFQLRRGPRPEPRLRTPETSNSRSRRGLLAFDSEGHFLDCTVPQGPGAITSASGLTVSPDGPRPSSSSAKRTSSRSTNCRSRLCRRPRAVSSTGSRSIPRPSTVKPRRASTRRKSGSNTGPVHAPPPAPAQSSCHQNLWPSRCRTSSYRWKASRRTPSTTTGCLPQTTPGRRRGPNTRSPPTGSSTSSTTNARTSSLGSRPARRGHSTAAPTSSPQPDSPADTT